MQLPIYIYMTPLHFHFSTLGQMDQLIQVVCEVQLPKGKTCGHHGHLEIETSPHTPIGGGGVVVDELDCWSIDGPKRKEMLHSSNFYK